MFFFMNICEQKMVSSKTKRAARELWLFYILHQYIFPHFLRAFVQFLRCKGLCVLMCELLILTIVAFCFFCFPPSHPLCLNSLSQHNYRNQNGSPSPFKSFSPPHHQNSTQSSTSNYNKLTKSSSNHVFNKAAVPFSSNKSGGSNPR